MLKAGNKKRQINCRLFGLSLIRNLASQHKASQYKINQHKIFEKTLSYVACLYL